MKTIPWEKVDIEVITIETNHAGEVFEGTRKEITEFLEDKGYILVYTVGTKDILSFHINILLLFSAIDDVFVRKDLYDGKYSPDMDAWAEFELMVGTKETLETINHQLKSDVILKSEL